MHTFECCIVQFLGWFNKDEVQTAYWINSVCSSVVQDKSREAQTNPLVLVTYGGDQLGTDILAGLVNHEKCVSATLFSFGLHAIGSGVISHKFCFSLAGVSFSINEGVTSTYWGKFLVFSIFIDDTEYSRSIC